MANLLTSSEARALLESTNKEQLSKALNIVDASIKEAISKGKAYCYVYPEGLTPQCLENMSSRLEDLGYLVKYTNSQRDGEYFVIAW